MRASACKFCGNTRESANPSSHHDGVYLKFVSQRDAVCVPCRNTVIVSYSHEDRGSFAKEVQPGGKRRDEFLSARQKWIEKHNSSATGVVTKKQFGVDESLDFTDQSGVKVEEVLGYLRPTALHKASFPESAVDAKSLTTVQYMGKPVTGVLKGPEHGWKPGVLKLTCFSEASVARHSNLDQSNDSLRSGQMDDTQSVVYNNKKKTV